MGLARRLNDDGIHEDKMLTGGVRTGRVAVVAVLALFSLVMIRTAWLCDDAFITFRVVDNFLHGDGLRWNVVERVQVYTHPLWMFLVSGIAFFTGEICITSLALSLVLSLTVAVIIGFRVSANACLATLSVLALTLSSSFVDYSTSGLENPLSHLLLLLFCLTFLWESASLWRVFLLSLLTALGMVNRLDTVLLCAPALALAVWPHKNAKAMCALILGMFPLLLWESFSLVYYGFLLPNTYYAKLGGGQGWRDACGAGLSYLGYSICRDPLTLVMFGSGFIYAAWVGSFRLCILQFGALLYLLYVVWIGGDYMSGRFLTLPFLVSVISLSRFPLTIRDSSSGRLVAIASFAVVVVLGLLSDVPTVFSGADCVTEERERRVQEDLSRWGATNARMSYYADTGLLWAIRGKKISECPAARAGLEMREKGVPFMLILNAGITPFYAGPETYFLDFWSLADPLRARLPLTQGTIHLAGHLFRVFPEGYVETITSGENRLEDEHLARYYDHLKLITQGPLLSRSRLKSIILVNLGIIAPRSES